MQRLIPVLLVSMMLMAVLGLSVLAAEDLEAPDPPNADAVEEDGEEIPPQEEEGGEEILPPVEEDGEEVPPPVEEDGEEISPPQEEPGEEVPPPEGDPAAPAEPVAPAPSGEVETPPSPLPEPEAEPGPAEPSEELPEAPPEETEPEPSEEIDPEPTEEPADEQPAEEASDEPLPILDGAAVSNLFPFRDVPSGAWYSDAAHYAYYHQLMNGVGGDAFSPDGYMTRGMVVTVLWRLAGSPAPSAASGFTDLTQAWYRDAVAWAQETGVTTGATADTFLPDARVTREQMTAFLARFAAGVRGVSTAAGDGLAAYPDRDDVSEYARAPMAWAIQMGLINGMDTNGAVILAPGAHATRAQVAAILMRFCQKLPEPGDTGSLSYLVDHTAAAGKTNQIVVVVDHNLTLWERIGGSWTKTVDVYAGYGANGMSADRTEGDMTTPIGAFPLLYAFGRDADPGTALEYRQITPNSYYSAASDGTYNTWVESSTPIPGERLMDYANLQYRYAVVIGFNMDPVVLGRGSAIFLHCKGATWKTGGCVSVTQSDMVTLLDRLNRGAWILIVRNAADLRGY